MKKVYMMIILIMLVMLCGCGAKEEESNVTYFHKSLNDVSNEEDTQAEEELSQSEELYLIVSINSAEESMRVYRYANGLEYRYYYGLETKFLNKYGDYMSVANLEAGDVINILGADSQGKATTVQLADSVWTYDDITRFSVDEDAGIMQIADTKYSIAGDSFVFIGDEKAAFSDISPQDKLSVIGIDKKILSVCVTTGHGTLQLENTELFDGSYLQLGTKIFVEITSNMQMEVPEGDYTLAVANDGWGGSTQISIQRGETTTVNLDELKGEGPKYSSIQFVVDVEGAQIYLDNSLIDYSQVNQVRYGNHSLTVVADGYDTWSRTLCVNSAEATIVISLTDGADSEETEDTGSSGTAQAVEKEDSRSSRAEEKSTAGSTDNSTTNNSGTTNGSSTTNSNGTTNSSSTTNSSGTTNGSSTDNSNNNSNSSNSTNSSTNSITNSELTDYLSTLSSLISSLQK